MKNRCTSCMKLIGGATHHLRDDKKEAFTLCSKCAEYIKLGGVILIQTALDSTDEMDRTGVWCVVKKDELAKTFKGYEELNKGDIFMMDSITWNKIGLPTKDVNNGT